MERVMGVMGKGIVRLLGAGLVLTPALGALRFLSPGTVPGWMVLVPLAAALHLALSWMAAQAVALVLIGLFSPTRR